MFEFYYFFHINLGSYELRNYMQEIKLRRYD